MVDMGDWLVTAEVADLLHVDTSRVRRYCESGDLKAVKLGGSWIVKKEDLEQFKKVRRRIGRPNKEPAP